MSTATKFMVNALADATLDSACLNKANFDRVTANLDSSAKAMAVQMHDAGIKTLNETKAWKTCKGQSEQATKLVADMSSAEMWSQQRASAKTAAMLSDTEEIRDEVLVDKSTRTPVNSDARLIYPLSLSTFWEVSYPTNRPFDAALTVSEEGLVTACSVVASSGSEFFDQTVCRKAQLLLRYRPAFVSGKMTTSTTHLRFRLN